MTENEMLDYLLSTELYGNSSNKRPYSNLYSEQQMMRTDKTIQIRELVERFIEIDKEYNGSPWDIKRILSNIDIIIPVQDRKVNK